MKNNKINSKTVKRLTAFLISLILVVLTMLVPTKYVVEGPGPIDQVAKYIHFNTKPKVAGGLYSTSVSERPALVFDYLVQKFNPGKTLIDKKIVYGEASNSKNYDLITDFEMDQATQMAKLYAAKKAQKQHKFELAGVFVMKIYRSSDFIKKLQTGDLIIKVDNLKFKKLSELQNYLAQLEIGRTVSLDVLRGKKKIKVSGKVSRLPESTQNGLGIGLNERFVTTTIPDFKIKVDDLGGPSAGLMFTLELYQELTQKDLTKGEKIAGTGTINSDGKVGMIGGVDKKIIGATKAHAKVFFVPTDQPPGYKKSQTNYAEALKTAKRINSPIKIVPVKTFEDALNYLTRQK